jgi:hypothetical protein
VLFKTWHGRQDRMVSTRAMAVPVRKQQLLQRRVASFEWVVR